MFMKQLFYLVFLNFIFLIECFSQETISIKGHADCYNAIELLTDSIGPTNAPAGFGQIMEINGDKKSAFSFEREHNTVWYKFTVTNNCVLTFDIIPVKPSDDYDFILYKYTNENFCEDVMTKEIKPVRTNLMKSSNVKGGRTGLSVYATDSFVAPGSGATYSRALEVGKSEIYYLVLDNGNKNGKGHTLLLHYLYCSHAHSVLKDHRGFDENFSIDELEADSVTDLNKPKSTLNIKIVDKQTNLPLTGSISILNSKSLKLVGKNFHLENVSQCTKTVIQKRKYIIECNADGYFPAVKERLISEKEIDITILLEKIEVGKNISMDNILFYGNTDKFIASSMPALKNLVNLLKMNKNLKIKINGHVNWPKKFANEQEAKFNMDLSFSRAKAVYDYLVKAGINPKRLDYEGFSNSRMIYPHPDNEQEAQMNRRVEIVIVSD